MIPARLRDKAARAKWQLGVPKFSLLSSAAACSGKMRKDKAFVAFLIPDFSFSLQFTRFRWEKPDEEQFFQETLSQCSHWRASAYVGGPNLLTWYGIYHMEKGHSQNGTSPGAYPTRILKTLKTADWTTMRFVASSAGTGTSRWCWWLWPSWPGFVPPSGAPHLLLVLPRFPLDLSYSHWPLSLVRHLLARLILAGSKTHCSWLCSWQHSTQFPDIQEISWKCRSSWKSVHVRSALALSSRMSSQYDASSCRRRRSSAWHSSQDSAPLAQRGHYAPGGPSERCTDHLCDGGTPALGS